MQAEVARTLARRREISDRVRRLLIEDIGVRREAFELDLDAPLFGSGLALDSVDGIELVVGIENAFGVTLPETDEVAAITRSINTIVDFVLATSSEDKAGLG